MIVRRVRPLLGTFVEVGFETIEQAGSASCLAQAFSAIGQIETLLNGHAPDSELTQLNRRPGDWLPLHHHTRRVLRLGAILGRLSGDRFNMTVGGELTRKGRLPCYVSHPYLDRGCHTDIEFRHNQVRLRRPVLLTLDGIAKGYAVDRAVCALKQAGITRGWVNAGGDMRVFGQQRLSVHIRGLDGYHSPVGLSSGAVASSRLSKHWIADFPATLITATDSPVTGDDIITVWARFTWRADALTKVAAGLDAASAKEIIGQLKGKIVNAGTTAPDVPVG
ncbi:FAD:protein FMN transferase [Bowmanella dokdonensis]|uniref:FAD:protein FMN transferase n=1 Tax=Bowmanella dokdonensis TaxID=751969 RepID=A0A939INW1_9ALTE|nr:FAD:protein FMN transferase [Bowmanella dokdonensis]MBN7826783.1 FAD:protein FMN transferase [Bowmanella dokdonensis]